MCVKEQPDQVERCPVETVETAHRQPGPPDLELSTATPGYLAAIYYPLSARVLPISCLLPAHSTQYSGALASCVGTSLAAIPGQCSNSSHTTVQIQEQTRDGQSWHFDFSTVVSLTTVITDSAVIHILIYSVGYILIYSIKCLHGGHGLNLMGTITANKSGVKV